MPYSTTATVRLAAGGDERLQQLTDGDDALLASAIAEADAWIDNTIGLRYRTPLSEPIDTAIAAIANAEAIYVLKARRDMVTEDDHRRHDERLERLKAYATGKLTLASGAGDPPESSRHIMDSAAGRDATKAISREKTKGYW